MSRERFNVRAGRARKQNGMIRAMMVSHDTRYPTLAELREVLRGLDEVGHADPDFGFRSFSHEEAIDYEC